MKKVVPLIPVIATITAVVALSLAAVLTANLWISAMDLIFALVLVGMNGYNIGRISERRAFMKSIAWMPKNMNVTENEDGTKVALVEKISGEIVTIELPDDITNSQEAVSYVLSVLNEGGDE